MFYGFYLEVNLCTNVENTEVSFKSEEQTEILFKYCQINCVKEAKR